jgi:nicotinate phosphoribosyltransferase
MSILKIPFMQNFKPTGVTPKLVEMTRRELDKQGFNHVWIIVSGGFNPDRIAEFEKLQVPVDAYGVGSYLMCGVNAFTADVVMQVVGPDVEGRRGSDHDKILQFLDKLCI